MSNALQILQAAYRANNFLEPSSFSTSQEFPLNIALDVLNQVIGEMNRLGNLEFTKTKTALTYSVGTYTYDLSDLSIDQRRIHYIRREALGYEGELTAYEYRHFQSRYRCGSLQTTTPVAWSKFSDTLELSSIPDQNYSLFVYHWKDLPEITATTDTFLIPIPDEDILKHNCEMYLGYKTGRWDYSYAVQAIKAKTAPFLVSTKNDSAVPQQMPAVF